jgi:amidase/aspartyl-tRNA(Asn)/glutamyl-tRNA(Gln) amidotransferase subunit A
MRGAGAVLVGTLAMDEFAYGFTTENSHRGPVRNPHDPARIAGGSSGGCGAAVASRVVPLALGSDTNGSIRVPSSLCGVWGLKPTFGRLSRRGSYPFVASLDHLGPFAATLAGLAACYDALQGPDGQDPACARRPAEPVGVPRAGSLDGVRIARLGGWFEERASSAACAAVDRACAALGAVPSVEWKDAALARAAAFVVTASEGGALHLPEVRKRYGDLEPLSRDRFAAGALVPAAWYLQAQRLRAAIRERTRALFADVDVLIAPATPCAATPIGETTLALGAERLPLRPSMGLLTQPLSSIGLPVLAAPIPAADGALPIAVQLIAAPWREELCFRVAAALEAAGVAVSPRPEISA